MSSTNNNNKKKITNLGKGMLTQYGYSSELGPRKRHESIKKSVERYGPVSVMRKLNAVCVLLRNKSPEKSAILCSDKDWIIKNYSKTINGKREYSKSPVTKQAKSKSNSKNKKSPRKVRSPSKNTKYEVQRRKSPRRKNL